MTTQLNKKIKWNDEARAGLLFVILPVLGFFLFTAGPFLFSIYASFTDWNSMTDITSLHKMDELDREFFYIGFENYKELFNDSMFWTALLNNLVYAVGVPIGMIWAFCLALLFNKDLPFIKAFRVIYYIPVVSSIVAVSLLWSWIYNGDYGLLNQFINWAFEIDGPNWLQNEYTVKPAIIFMCVWRGVGGTALLYLGGLQNLPKSYFEAARIDGANAWTIFTKITWPLMKPISFYVLITGIIGSSQQIVENQMMAPTGGPEYKAATIVFYIWQQAFGADRKGFACAASWVLALIVFAVTAIQFKLSPSSENYLE